MRTFSVSLLLVLLAGICKAQVPLPSGCTDEHQHCVFWSQKGECETNPKWMKKHCRKACGTCPATTTRPQDMPTSRAFPFFNEDLAPTALPSRPQSIPEGCNSVMTVEVETRQVFSVNQVRGRNSQQQCADQQRAGDCTINMCYHKKYRSMDGTCNNLHQPTFGAAFVAFSRLLPAAYDDGVNTLVDRSVVFNFIPSPAPAPFTQSMFPPNPSAPLFNAPTSYSLQNEYQPHPQPQPYPQFQYDHYEHPQTEHHVHHYHHHSPRRRIKTIIVGGVAPNFGSNDTSISNSTISTIVISKRRKHQKRSIPEASGQAASTRRRPNPREVSVFLLSSARSLPTHANSLLMQFGQFVSHDITSNAVGPSCNSCNSAGPLCAHVLAPPSDRFRRCIAFTRSFPVCGTGQFGRVREQLNENTAFLDGSLIYGSESISARSLRFGAMLRASIVNGRVFPPIVSNQMVAGDSRSSLFVGLAALHTSFLRLHNNLAARLQNMNRQWSADRIFQETRKIVGGVIQVITYQEFVPTLIGQAAQTRMGAYNGYDPSVNPAIINEFAAAAYRLHGMIQEEYPLLGADFRQIGKFTFIEGVFNFNRVLSNIDSIYRGLMATATRGPQRLTTSVTEKLFGGSADMATTNIQRGRDHGLRSYNDYRKLCNLPAINDFNNWKEVSDAAVRQRVGQLYQSPDDLDLYVGGILEDPEAGSIVGPTFSCIIGKQFQRLRDGDRFYYENPGVFTTQQVTALKKVSLSWVLCQTGDSMTRIGRQAFEIDQGSRSIPCSSVPSLDMNAWMEQ